MMPVDDPSERPVGRPPLITDHEKGNWPPVMRIVSEYGTSLMPLGRLAVVMMRSPTAPPARSLAPISSVESVGRIW